MIQNAHTDLGRLDILVNNVGIQYVSPVHTFPEDKWDAIIAVCLSSAFHSHEGSAPVHDRAGLGQDHQHRLHACIGGLAIQERLQCSQAWHSR